MFIKEIELKNFRNYDELTLSFNDKVNFIVGNNAQGKTNLLEGIYTSALGKSFRTSKDVEMIGFGSDYCKVKVTAQKDLFLTEVEIIISSERGKSIKLDGVNVNRASDLLENVYIVIFSPEDLRIVKDEPEKRRRFIDRELCLLKPAYYDALNNYKKVLVQRNVYLKEKRLDPAVLDVWDIQLAAYGAKIISMRKVFIEKLNEISRSIHGGITNGREDLRVEYDPNVKCREDQESYLYESIRGSQANDMRLRTTTRGPHRDDIQAFIGDVNVRNFGSQGQQRTAALSLKLAELELIRNETGENAVLLLDDVMSELDQSRQEFLVRSLEDVQLFITSTEITDNLKDVASRGKIYEIEDGKVRS